MNGQIDIQDSEERYPVSCPAQGIDEVRYSLDELEGWIARQIEFWESAELPETQVYLANRNAQLASLSLVYTHHWKKLRAANDYETRINLLAHTLDAADALRLILVGGTLFETFKDYLDAAVEQNAEYNPAKNEFQQATVLAVAAHYSRHFQPILMTDREGSRLLDLIGLIVRMHPAAKREEDRARLSELVNSAESLMHDTDAFLSKVQARTEEQEAHVERLTEVFAEKLKLEAPASYWETVCKDARGASWKWLAAFMAAVLGPLILAWLNWSELSSAITAYLADTGIGGAAFVSVLGIGYGWVLKHLSRGFVQNLLIADDAKHRNVMTMTYLALSKDADVEIADNERALILNALFRPAPPANADDGPPASLIELIRK